MNKKIIKKVIILGSIILIIGIILVTIGLLINNHEQKTKPIDNPSNLDGNILGEERANIETISIDLIEKYMKKIPNLEEYAKENNKTSFSISDLKSIFNIDISEFEKLEYNCNPDSTIISYTDDYNDYYITLYCEVLLQK